MSVMKVTAAGEPPPLREVLTVVCLFHSWGDPRTQAAAVTQGFLKFMSRKEQLQPVIWCLVESISVMPIMHLALHS